MTGSFGENPAIVNTGRARRAWIGLVAEEAPRLPRTIVISEKNGLGGWSESSLDSMGPFLGPFAGQKPHFSLICGPKRGLFSDKRLWLQGNGRDSSLMPHGFPSPLQNGQNCPLSGQGHFSQPNGSHFCDNRGYHLDGPPLMRRSGCRLQNWPRKSAPLRSWNRSRSFFSR